jgi:hypothetical protein
VEGALRAAGVGTSGRPVRVRLDAPAVAELDSLRLRFTPSGETQPVTEARADPRGTVTATLPPDRYQAQVESDLWDGALEVFELTIPDGATRLEASHTIRGLGVVRVRSRETGLGGEDRGPTPARVRVREAAPGGRVVYERYALAEHRFFVPAGRYAVTVSRGPEHELHRTEVEVRDGETTEVAAELARVVDRAGWVSTDLHVHGTRSTDSETAREVRVLGAAAEGLDLLVSSDHDAVTDYGPVAAALGLASRLRTAPGTEMSMLYGHMNGYPVPASRPEDHWRPGWFVYAEDGRFERVLEPHEVSEALRAEGAQVVQINHPRSSQDLFGYIGFDAETGRFEGPFPDADAVELLNGKRLDEYEQVLADFHRLIVDGRRLTGVGTSDIHDDLGVGYARTYVRVGHEGPLEDLDLDDVWRGIQEGRAVAASGPFVEISLARGGEAAEIGQTLVGRGPATLSVTVQAPSWMTPERLRVLVSGEVLVDREIRPEEADPARPALRLDTTFTATVTADAYFMAEVRGSGGRPYLREVLTVTNPVWADADGDGLSF